MNVIWKAACAAVLLLAATTIEIGCGDTYRPVAVPTPVSTGNPSGAETEVVMSCCLSTQNAVSGSVLTAIDVSGDSNAGNKVVGSVANSVTFDANRTTVFTTNNAPVTNPSSYSLTQVSLNSSTAGFSANATTIALDSGSAPIGMSFQYFGSTYTLDYSINSGATPTCPTGGSLGAIAQASAQLKATICVGVNPVVAWIFKDQTKVFVLDKTENQVYVVSASKFAVTNKIPVGTHPIKAAQSNDGNYIYVLNSGNGTTDNGSISIIDGQGLSGVAETVIATVHPTDNAACGVGSICDSPVIDIAQDSNYNDTSKNTQINHVWLLHQNGTVSVYDGTTPGTLKWITALSTKPAGVPTNASPTNLALMRDGTEAYVGYGNSDQIVGIDTSKLGYGSLTSNATTAITVGVHRSITATLKDTKGVAHSVLVESTRPTVTGIAVSRGGASADLSKVYATTTTQTTYYCFDGDVNPTDCNNTDPWDGTSSFIPAPITPYLPPTIPTLQACVNLAGQNAMSCSHLYDGTAVVAAAANGSTPINTYITTVPTPSIVTYCNPGNSAAGIYDGQKNCPVTTPQIVLGRS